MDYQDVFERYEMKYLMTKEQKKKIFAGMRPYVKSDIYGRSTICNVYYDTPDYLLIRRSLERPVYKEKLRVRSYGPASHNSQVFIELKKKYQSIVYKRRVCAKASEAAAYLCRVKPLPVKSQITGEIDYFLSLYPELIPTVFLAYRRESFYAKEDENVRITFDDHLLWRDAAISLCTGVYGRPLMEEGQVLMEIKTAGAIPLWLTGLLSDNQVYKSSYSKYGNVYQLMRQEKQAMGGRRYA